MKVKLDNFYLGVLINRLYKHKDSFSGNTGIDLSDFLLRLVDEYRHLKSGQKKRIAFQLEEISLVRTCLMSWRNEKLQAEKETAVEVISETLTKFL
ncbi:MAG: hypothetical protein ACERKV_01130 [Clostridiaceae bacterium]